MNHTFLFSRISDKNISIGENLVWNTKMAREFVCSVSWYPNCRNLFLYLLPSCALYFIINDLTYPKDIRLLSICQWSDDLPIDSLRCVLCLVGICWIYSISFCVIDISISFSSCVLLWNKYVYQVDNSRKIGWREKKLFR